MKWLKKKKKKEFGNLRNAIRTWSGLRWSKNKCCPIFYNSFEINVALCRQRQRNVLKRLEFEFAILKVWYKSTSQLQKIWKQTTNAGLPVAAHFPPARPATFSPNHNSKPNQQTWPKINIFQSQQAQVGITAPNANTSKCTINNYYFLVNWYLWVSVSIALWLGCSIFLQKFVKL